MVAELLEAATAGSVGTELVTVETSGDRRRQVPIHSVGGQGVFVKEVDAMVLEGRADASVHSAKDLPGDAGLSLPIVAVPPRAEARDALAGSALAELGAGARVATGSVRRRAQLAWLRPDLCYEELRGNLGTRLSKVPPGGAVVVAAAALERLGLLGRMAELLPVAVMLPQVGQGTIAVCARPGGDASVLLAEIDDEPSRRTLEAERGYLNAIGGGCSLPVAAYATTLVDGSIDLRVMLASLDGHVMLQERGTGSEPARLGEVLGKRLLERSGGHALLERVAERTG